MLLLLLPPCRRRHCALLLCMLLAGLALQQAEGQCLLQLGVVVLAKSTANKQEHMDRWMGRHDIACKTETRGSVQWPAMSARKLGQQVHATC